MRGVADQRVERTEAVEAGDGGTDQSFALGGAGERGEAANVLAHRCLGAAGLALRGAAQRSHQPFVDVAADCARRRSCRLERLQRLEHPVRELGGKQTGVDGAGDRRIDGDAGDHGRADGAGDIGRSQAAPGLGDENDTVGPGEAAGADQRQVARPGHQQAAGVAVDQRRWRRPAPGVDDDVQRRGAEDVAQRRPPRRVARDRRRPTRDERRPPADLDGEVEDRLVRGVRGEPVAETLGRTARARRVRSGNSPSTSTSNESTADPRASAAATTVVPLPPFADQHTLRVIRGLPERACTALSSRGKSVWRRRYGGRRRSATPGRSETATAVRRLGDGEQRVGEDERPPGCARRLGRRRRASSNACRRGRRRTARGCRRRCRPRRRRRGAWPRTAATLHTPVFAGSSESVTPMLTDPSTSANCRAVSAASTSRTRKPLLVPHPLRPVRPRVGDGELHDVVDGTLLGEPLVDEIDVADELPQRQLDARCHAPQVVDLAGAARRRSARLGPLDAVVDEAVVDAVWGRCARRRTRRRRRARSPSRGSAATSSRAGRGHRDVAPPVRRSARPWRGSRRRGGSASRQRRRR